MQTGFQSRRAIGILGGSFDPAHAGHLHISKAALRVFGLREVWWLMSPGNPLKARGPAELGRRIAAAEALIDTPRIKVSDFEARAGSHYTAETLALLTRAYPRERFVWLMGADNLAQFHRWQNWEDILARVPVGVFARPGDRQAALNSKTARIYRHARLKGRRARLLAQAEAPAWAFVSLSMRNVSSSAIRAAGGWQSG
ncbi:nicotinate-nucleotide adenylyltransferase [Pseudaestuariivita atlantica]|uniref:Probable nicotinate-nucleotide adenylyltransferase n=1 Tax=Pseudaestuariivita atlantica TaxID=1317121 RepID=A0A0L1JRY1_9RHOB|nr:nicotinate-nucleotide adenylyltransferase [Pseudaestuariivita atlantica]KNG94452.1 nicotinate-nucleotide adenylyltransferase [Pseudaestuariivita atlantica]